MGTSYYELKIENRSLIKKKGAKSLRREGLIPGVLYFKGEPTENIEVNKNIINKNPFKKICRDGDVNFFFFF